MNVDEANTDVEVANLLKCIKLLKSAGCTATISIETPANTALCTTYDATFIKITLATVRAYKTAVETNSSPNVRSGLISLIGLLMENSLYSTGLPADTDL